MLPQEEMIGRLRHICQQDARLLAAMHYGSITRQEADQYSDLDIMLFFEDGAVAIVDQKDWLEPSPFSPDLIFPLKLLLPGPQHNDHVA